MSSGADFFIKKTLGEDFIEILHKAIVKLKSDIVPLIKTEIYKPGSRTTVDVFDIEHGLKLVPRAIMALLIRELVPMAIGETKEIAIPLQKTVLLRITKHERDSLSGEIIEDNKKIAEFMHRSIPGVGLVIMSALELYDTDKLLEPIKNEDNSISDMVQKLVDERLALHDLVGRVVDKKLSQRDAIQQLVLAKLSEPLVSAPKSIPIPRRIEVPHSMINKQEDVSVETPKKKSLPLKDFLSKRENKLKKSEYPIQLIKGEHVSCPDCGKNIFNGELFSGCICFGDDMDKKIYIKKSEDGVKVRFGKGWDPENIEMLLEVLRRKRG